MEALRSGGFKGKVTMITREGHNPIDRTKLSKALMGDASKVELRSDEWYKNAAIDKVEGNVTSVDFGSKKVDTEDGKSYSYTKLILASGGSAKFLPMDGLNGDLENVFLLRSITHVQDILKAAGEDGGKKIVVIGSSFIGMEVANCLAGMKHDVTVVGMEKQPMERVMGQKVGAIFKALVEKNGVKFIMESGVDKAMPSKSDPKKVGSVQIKDGPEIEVDLVVEGVGIKPSTDYLEGTKEVELNKDGSVNVDETFAVKGLKDVYAVGDIASYPYHGPGGNGKPVRIEHWNVAQNAGRAAATHIINPSAKPKPFIPVFWSAMGAQLRYCGHTPDGYDDVIVQGETGADKPSWVAYYTKGEEVLAVASMMKDPYMAQSAELMRRGKMPKKSELNKGVDIMEISIPAEVKM